MRFAFYDVRGFGVCFFLLFLLFLLVFVYAHFWLKSFVCVLCFLHKKKKKKNLDQKSQLFSFFCPKFSPQKRDEACVVDKVFLIIIIIQTRIL